MSAPRIRLYKAVDDNDFAAVFLGPSGKPLPVFYLAAGKTRDEAQENAEAWWNEQQAKATAGKGPKRKDPAPVSIELAVEQANDEDIFG